MAGILVAVVFKILNFIAQTFLSPIVSGIASLFPTLSNFFSYIITYIGYGLQFTSFFVKLLMIPKAPLIVLIGLWVGIFAFNLTIHVVGLGVAIYRWFKP